MVFWGDEELMVTIAQLYEEAIANREEIAEVWIMLLIARSVEC